MTEQILDTAPASDQTPSGSDGNVGGGDASADIDGLIDRYLEDPQDLGGGADEEVPGEGSPEPLEDSEDGTPGDGLDPDDDFEETPEEAEEGDEEVPGLDDEEAEAEDDPTEVDEELDALLEATDEGSDEPAPRKKDSDEESFLPPFDRAKFLEEHPELEVPYKHMQAAFTRKMQSLSGKLREAEKLEADAKGQKEQHDAFMALLADDNSFKDFLVQTALHRPEVVESALDEVVSLNEDEGKKKEFLGKKELEEREQKVRRAEQQQMRQAMQNRLERVSDLTIRAAQKLGLVGEGDIEVVDQFVANQINSNRSKANGKKLGPDELITDEQVVSAVRRAAKALNREKGEARKAAKSEQRKENLEAAKRRAKERRRPTPPKGGNSPAPGKREVRKTNPNQRTLDAFIDTALGIPEGEAEW